MVFTLRPGVTNREGPTAFTDRFLGPISWPALVVPSGGNQATGTDHRAERPTGKEDRPTEEEQERKDRIPPQLLPWPY